MDHILANSIPSQVYHIDYISANSITSYSMFTTWTTSGAKYYIIGVPHGPYLKQ